MRQGDGDQAEYLQSDPLQGREWDTALDDHSGGGHGQRREDPEGNEMKTNDWKVPVQSLIDHIKTAVDVDPWAKEMAEELLKEQELGHWIFLTDCSNSGVYCSECNTKVFDSYPFKKKLSCFCPHCGTRMEGEIERR